MSMSKQDFEMLAEEIAATGGDYATREEMAVRFSVRLKQRNPRFDQGRFLEACGFGS